jgi:hypothetical protein
LEPRLDDFVDGDPFIVAADGRNGRWQISNDGTGEQIPAQTSRLRPNLVTFDQTERFVLHSTGSQFTGWGAAVGFDFQRDGSALCAYNLALYQGIEFTARGAGEIRIEISVPETLSVENGGSCAGKGCDNRHGFPLQLSPEWQRYRVNFNQLAQESGWGQPASFTAERVLQLRFRAIAQPDFDLWLADVRLFPDLSLIDASIDASANQDGG